MSSGKSIPENAGECCRMRDPCLHGEDKEPVENSKTKKGKEGIGMEFLKNIGKAVGEAANSWEKRTAGPPTGIEFVP